MNKTFAASGLFTLAVFGMGVGVGSLAIRPAVSNPEIVAQTTPSGDIPSYDVNALSGRSCPSLGDFIDEYVDPDTGITGEDLLTSGSTEDLLGRYFYGYCLRNGYVE